MGNNLEKKLSELNVMIASHIFASGPALELEEYLKNKVNSLLFIGHPFAEREEKNSFYRYYIKGKLIREHKALLWNLPYGLMYFKDALYTLWWVIRWPQKIDLFIGSDNFTAFFGLIAKWLGKVEDVILYTIDYVPQRFANPIFNFLYHFFDIQCLKQCKIVWNVSFKIAEAREKYNGLQIKNYTSQIVVPLGIWYDRIRVNYTKKRDKYTIVFLGHLLEKQGLQMVIKAMPQIAKKIPHVKLVVIGTGPFESSLKKYVSDLKMDGFVSFLGYIDDHQEVEKQLFKSTIAVATYKPDPSSFTYFADPGKIKNYLAAGLPVILTDVPPIAKEIAQKRCALIAKYDVYDFADKVDALLTDRIMLSEYSRNAIKFAEQFDWDKIFTEALEKTFNAS